MLTTILEQVLRLPGIGADMGWGVLLENWPQNTPRIAAVVGKQPHTAGNQEFEWLSHCNICMPFIENEEPSPYTIPTAPCFAPAPTCPGGLGLKSHIAFPIRVGKRTLGVIILAWLKPVPFSQEDYKLLHAIGQQIGLALRNAQLYRSAAQSDRLKVLNTISVAAGSSLEMDVVLSQVLELTCKSISASSGAILQMDPNQESLIFSQTYGERSEILRGERLSFGQGIVGWVAEHRQTVCVNDTRHDPRWFPELDKKTRYTTKSVLCAPLLYRDKITGVIEIINKEQGDFTHEDVSLLESVAAISSVAIENARLFTTTRARAQEIETLFQISTALSASLDFKNVVKKALSQIQRLFQAFSVALLQFDETDREMVNGNVSLGTEFIELSFRLPEEESARIEWVVKNRQAVLIKDASTDSLFRNRVSQSLFATLPGSIMVVPMLTTHRVMGILLVASDQVNHYSDTNLHTLQAIVATLTVSLENAGLYEDLKALLHERDIAQANIVQNEKMAALGRLAASIAHEINNPLQAIQGCLTLFNEEMESDNRREKLDFYLNIVHGEIERITKIISRMRDYYRPENKSMQTMDLHACLDSVLDLTGKQLQQNNIVVERNWTSFPILLQARQDQLKQVFLNLVLNAMDAMPEGGTLTVTTRFDRLELKTGLPTAAVLIEFQDTGIGIPAEIQANIFEPFFSTKEHGSGLGLSISYGIIQSHQGVIRLSSKPGMGATFTILLPLEHM